MPVDIALSQMGFVVLNTIHLKKITNAEMIAVVTAIPRAQVEVQLEDALRNEQAMDLPDGVMLLPAGTRAVLAYYHEAYANIRMEENMVQWYARFEGLNRQFIAAVSGWQQGIGDEGMERKLIQCVDRLVRNLGQLSVKIPRYTGYMRRFESGLDRIVEGQRDYVCNPGVDSIHNIWFEFHEDILAVLGRPRDST